MDIKKGISDFYLFSFYSSQNTHTNDPMRPIRPTSLSFTVKGQQIGRDIDINKGIWNEIRQVEFLLCCILFCSKFTKKLYNDDYQANKLVFHYNDSIQPIRQKSLSVFTNCQQILKDIDIAKGTQDSYSFLFRTSQKTHKCLLGKQAFLSLQTGSKYQKISTF